MCRMLAKISLLEEPITYEFLDAPHSLLQQSRCGHQPHDPSVCGPHASGCGMAFITGGDVQIERCGAEDNWSTDYQIKVREVRTQIVIGHNRKATAGLKVEKSCSHPFMRSHCGQTVAICHNGTVYTLVEEAKARGVSDSEIFLEQILSGLTTIDTESVARQVEALARNYEYSSLSAFLISPKAIFAWRLHGSGRDSGEAERFPKYYTLYKKETPTNVLIASEPIDKTGEWQLIPNGQFYSLTIEAGRVKVAGQTLRF